MAEHREIETEKGIVTIIDNLDEAREYRESPYTNGLGEFLKYCPYLRTPKSFEIDEEGYITGYTCKVFLISQRRNEDTGELEQIGVDHFESIHSVYEAQVIVAECIKLSFHHSIFHRVIDEE